jgi:cytidylate kinase
MSVSNLVSKVAAIPEVRKFLVKEQRRIGSNKGIVMDGRDIGTVVFPEAELKIFMTASPEIRANRRLCELREIDDSIKFNEVYKNIIDRDSDDSSRKDSPLIKPDDAFILDNSNLSKSDQFKLVLSLANNLIN